MPGLALQVIDGAGLALKPPAQSVTFAAHESWEHVLAGRAEVEQVRAIAPRPGGIALQRANARLSPGSILHRKGREVAQIYQRVPGVLVLLRLQRPDGSSDPSCEYALDDGRLLHQSAASPRDSRLELAVSLLGRMGRADAAPLLAAMAEETGSPHLRWQALRECLALDSRAGFLALSAIAKRSEDPLAAPAGALRAQIGHVDWAERRTPALSARSVREYLRALQCMSRRESAALRQALLRWVHEGIDALEHTVGGPVRVAPQIVGDRILEVFMAQTLNPPPSRLIACYAAWRATLRARLSIAHLLEPTPRQPEKWEPQARRYLAIAAHHLENSK